MCGGLPRGRSISINCLVGEVLAQVAVLDEMCLRVNKCDELGTVLYDLDAVWKRFGWTRYSEPWEKDPFPQRKRGKYL